MTVKQQPLTPHTTERARTERFKALDATREAFKDVPDEELEREANRGVLEARLKRRAVKQDTAQPA